MNFGEGIAHLCAAKLASDPQAYDLIEDNSGIAARWFFNYDQFILDHAVQIFHNHEAIYDGDIFVKSRTGFRVPIWSGIKFTNEIQADYYNGYPSSAHKKKIDTRYMFSLGYGW